MTTYVFRNGRLVEKHLAEPLNYGQSAPYVIGDIMEPTRHMADGNYYSSKSKFREVTKAHGCVEVGNDPAISRPRKPIPLSSERRREDIRRVIQELKRS